MDPLKSLDAKTQPEFSQSDERLAQLLREAAQQPAAPSPSVLTPEEVQAILAEAGAAPPVVQPGQLTDTEVQELLEDFQPPQQQQQRPEQQLQRQPEQQQQTRAEPARKPAKEPDLGVLAEHARSEMVDPFHKWVAEKRRKTEIRVFRQRERIRDLAPFAARAIQDVEPTTDTETEEVRVIAPVVIWEFASTALQLEEDEAAFKLLNRYYFVMERVEVDFGATDDNEQAIRALWDWYLAELDELE